MIEIIKKLNEDIDLQQDDISYPTHDADINLAEFLRDSTVFGLDEKDEEIPGFILADTIVEMLGISLESLIDFSIENGFVVYKIKVIGEELPLGIFAICAEGCDTQLIKDEYNSLYELEIEVELYEPEEEQIEEALTADNKAKIERVIVTDVPLNKLSIFQGLNLNSIYKSIGWLANNVSKITFIVPIEVEDVFRKTFDIKDDSVVFKDIKLKGGEYTADIFNRRAHIELRDSRKMPKELRLARPRKKGVVIDELKIQSFELVRALVKDYCFNFGTNNPEEVYKKIKDKYSDNPSFLKSFEAGFSLYDIEKEEEKVRDLYNNKLIHVPKDAEEWLKNNISTFRIEVPTHKERIFTQLWGSDVKHYVIDTSTNRDAKWDISVDISIKTQEGMPPFLAPYFRGGAKKVSSVELGLGLLKDFGPEAFGLVVDDNIDENVLLNTAKKHKKANKKKGRGWFENPDAGDVEKNIAFFNRAMGNPSSDVDMSASVAESIVEDMVEVLPKYLYHATFKPRIRSIRKYGLGGRVPRMRSYDYEGTIYQNQKQGVFLATSYDVAYSYAEIAFEDIEDGPDWMDDLETNIVVYAVAVEKLDKTMIEDDANVIDDNATVFYRGVIPFEHLIKVEDDIEEQVDNLDENASTLSEVLPQEEESKVDFVARFMKETEDEYPNPKQRYAVALSYWEKR